MKPVKPFIEYLLKNILPNTKRLGMVTTQSQKTINLFNYMSPKKPKGVHGIEGLPWHELSYKQQASSINATIRFLNKAIPRHLEKAKEAKKDKKETLAKCTRQLEKLIKDINEPSIKASKDKTELYSPF